MTSSAPTPLRRLALAALRSLDRRTTARRRAAVVVVAVLSTLVVPALAHASGELSGSTTGLTWADSSSPDHYAQISVDDSTLTDTTNCDLGDVGSNSPADQCDYVMGVAFSDTATDCGSWLTDTTDWTEQDVGNYVQAAQGTSLGTADYGSWIRNVALPTDAAHPVTACIVAYAVDDFGQLAPWTSTIIDGPHEYDVAGGGTTTITTTTTATTTVSSGPTCGDSTTDPCAVAITDGGPLHDDLWALAGFLAVGAIAVGFWRVMLT